MNSFLFFAIISLLFAIRFVFVKEDDEEIK